jgi:hypothetical protein
MEDRPRLASRLSLINERAKDFFLKISVSYKSTLPERRLHICEHNNRVTESGIFD